MGLLEFVLSWFFVLLEFSKSYLECNQHVMEGMFYYFLLYDSPFRFLVWEGGCFLDFLNFQNQFWNLLKLLTGTFSS